MCLTPRAHRLIRRRTGSARRPWANWVACLAIAITGSRVDAQAPLASDTVALQHGSSGQRPARPDGLGSVVRVCAGGDVTLGTNLDTAWMSRQVRAGGWQSPDSLVTPLRALMRGADVVLINEEGALGDDSTDGGKCLPHHRYCFMLRSPAAAATALRRIGDSTTTVGANIANNHAHDAGDSGFSTTRRLLADAGVLVVGADTEPAIAVTPTGDTVALLGFSAWATPGVDDLDAVERLVRRAAARYRRVIVTAHLGAEGQGAQRTGDSVEEFAGERRGNAVAFAHRAVDAGAGLVIGHGPHVLRAGEWRGGALILYSMGNLLNYGPFMLRGPTARGAVLCANLDSAGRPSDVILRPTRQPGGGVVRPDGSRRALALVDSLSRLDFPLTGVRVDRKTGAVTQRPDETRPPDGETLSHPRPATPMSP